MNYDKDLPDPETIEEINRKEAEGFKPAAGRDRILRFVAYIGIIVFLFLILGRVVRYF